MNQSFDWKVHKVNDPAASPEGEMEESGQGWERIGAWPTHAEVREIVQAIIRHIDSAPDWSPSLEAKPSAPPDETWKGWGKR